MESTRRTFAGAPTWIGAARSRVDAELGPPDIVIHNALRATHGSILDMDVDDLEQNFRSVLKGGLQKLDLVTREEFEVQEAVLARTREKLEALEKQVAELEGSSD